MIAGVPPYETCRDIFSKFSILTMPSMYVFELCVYVYNNRDKFALNSDIHSKGTRQEHKIHTPFAKSKIKNYSPNHIGVKFYNKIPQSIVNSKTLLSFKRNLKHYLLEKTIYDISSL